MEAAEKTAHLEAGASWSVGWTWGDSGRCGTQGDSAPFAGKGSSQTWFPLNVKLVPSTQGAGIQ